MTTAARSMKLGDRVIFHSDHSGLPETAMVTGTYRSIDAQRAKQRGQVPPVSSEDRLHLSTFPPTGGIEPRYNVQPGSEPGCWEPRDGTG